MKLWIWQARFAENPASVCFISEADSPALGAQEWAIPAESVIISVIGVICDRFFCLHIFQFLGIGDRRGDYVCAAGPLAQIDQTAAFTAERRVLVTRKHQRPAGGAAKRTGFLSGHSFEFEILNLKSGNFISPEVYVAMP